MNFFANPAIFQNGFSVPLAVVEKHLKLATDTQLRVLLYALSHLADDPSDEQISAFLSIDIDDVADAYNFWEAAGVFISKNGQKADTTNIEFKKVTRNSIIKPTREEVVKRGSENKQLSLLLHEAEAKFTRPLKFSEISTFVWLFDDMGMDVSLILMLIEYAKSEERLNISFIERTAAEWINNNINSITDAEKYITDMYRKRTAWKIVEAAFGIEDRLPSAKELEYSELWINNWKLSREILKAAYERCVDAKSKFNMSYTAKILENWHSKGYKTVEEIKAAEEKTKAAANSSMAAYDIKELEKLINA